MTDCQTIILEQSGAVARITLNRPAAANGMNDNMTRDSPTPRLAATRRDKGRGQAFFSAGR